MASELGLRRRPLSELLFGKITHVDLPALADDALWNAPAVRAATARHGDLRGDLARLAAVAPALVEAYEDLPHGLAHGDATPDNLHEPTTGDIVAIDLSYAGPAALGSDLGQLLVGRFESGAATEADLDAIGTTLLPAYLDGLADEGVDVDPHLVEAGWAITLAVRSVFSALVVDHRPDLDPPARDQLLARRALTCRFGLDLALTSDTGCDDHLHRSPVACDDVPRAVHVPRVCRPGDGRRVRATQHRDLRAQPWVPVVHDECGRVDGAGSEGRRGWSGCGRRIDTLEHALGALQSEAFLQIVPAGGQLDPTHYLFECREL